MNAVLPAGLATACTALAVWVLRLRSQLRRTRQAWESDVDSLHADLRAQQNARRAPRRQAGRHRAPGRAPRHRRVAGQRATPSDIAPPLARTGPDTIPTGLP